MNVDARREQGSGTGPVNVDTRRERGSGTGLVNVDVRREQGSGTLLMVGVMAVVGVVATVGMVAAGYLVAGHRARGAADLAALSGAAAYAEGRDPCAAARRLARSNDARLTRCDRVGDDVAYVVSVTAVVDVGIRVPGLPRTLAARAHAGPTG